MNHKAILFPYPKCHLNDVKQHIPSELNNATLDRHITSPDAWKTRVLYISQKEWRACMNEDYYCIEVGSEEKIMPIIVSSFIFLFMR